MIRQLTSHLSVFDDMYWRLKILAAFAASASSLAYAGDADSLLLESIEIRTGYFNRNATVGYEDNPALQLNRFKTSLSDISVGYAVRTSDEAIMTQEGKGQRGFSFDSRSYMPLSDRSVVWGRASYENADRLDVRWCDAVDYQLISPYVLGDSVGGDLSMQRYSFGGGYAAAAGRWRFGVSAFYRAEIDSRNRDPRLKVIVSDLDLRLGSSYALSQNYSIGLSAALRVYNQDNDLDFYNPVNNIRTYALTGAGTYSSRFSGNNSNASYSFVGFSTGLQLHPSTEYGFAFSGGYSYYKMGQVLKDLNNLTLGEVSSHTFSAQAAKNFRIGSVSLGIVADVWWNRRIAGENLFGTSVGNSYDKISTRYFYYNDKVDCNIRIPLEISFDDSGRLTVAPKLAFAYSHENYRRPHRDIEWRSISPALELTYVSKCGNKWLMEYGIIGGWRSGTRMNFELDGMNPYSSLYTMVANDYGHASSDGGYCSAGIEADRIIASSVALYCRACGGVITYSGYSTFYNVSLSVGAKF